MRSFSNDRRGIAAVAIVAIIMVPLTFMVWLLSYTPVLMMMDVIEPLTTNVEALAIYDEVHTVVSAFLIVEVIAIIVWWGASAFRKEDQTYRSESYGY